MVEQCGLTLQRRRTCRRRSVLAAYDSGQTSKQVANGGGVLTVRLVFFLDIVILFFGLLASLSLLPLHTICRESAAEEDDVARSLCNGFVRVGRAATQDTHVGDAC